MTSQDERRPTGLCVLDALAALRHPKPLLGAGIAVVLVGFLLSSFFLQGPAVQLAWLVPFSLSLAVRSFVESLLELLLFQLSSIPLVLWTAAALSGASSRSPAMRKQIGRSNAVLLRDVAGVSVVMALAFAAINTLYWAPHWPRQDGLTPTPDPGYAIRVLPALALWFVSFLALSGVVLYGEKPLRALRHAVELSRRRWKDATALLIVLLVGSYLAAWIQSPFYHGVHVGFLMYWTLLILPPGSLVAYVVLTAVCLRVAGESIIMSQPPPPPRGAARKDARRPGLVTAAAVLMFVGAGMGILTLITLFASGFVPSGFGIVTLALAGFDIWVGIQVLNLKETGRLLGILLAAIGAVLALAEMGNSAVAGIASLAIHGFIIYALVRAKECFTK